MFDLYDDYAHSRINRRDFVERLSIYAVGGITVPALMSFLMPDYKNTLQTKTNDPRLVSEYITYNSEKGGRDDKSAPFQTRRRNQKAWRSCRRP